MRILVTGASGFAGSLLVPRLRADGHAVRALARQPARVEEALARLPRGSEKGGSPLDVVRGDVLTGAGLARGMDDVEVAYYLIHSMERSAEGSAPFAERERIAAEKFAEAAAHAGVRRIIYLGGLLPRWSDGASMRSLLVHLVERMPILTLPAWQAFRTQPIDARDVTEMLLAAADAPLGGSSLEIAGPDVLTYGQMMAGIAELMLVNRPSIRLGVNLTGITARVAAAIAGEDPDLVMPLMEGLQGDLLPEDDDAAQLLNVPLHNFESAVENALRDWERREPLAAR
jgi:uncharacterized protein YbjT (DUF2867 family)